MINAYAMSFLSVALTTIFLGAVVSTPTTDEPTQTPLLYDAPDDCQWWVRDSPSGSEEVALSCKLRSINSEMDTTNFSVIPSEHTTSLKIECNNEEKYKSSLDDRSFAHLTRLRELILDSCKLGKWPSGTLAGLKELRNLTVRTRNTDWSSMNLEISADSFLPVRHLERLDLSTNNIWSFPENIFCPMTNLVLLNISYNRLQDVSELGFREKTPPPQPLISTQEDIIEDYPESLINTPCTMDIQILDTSWNHFVLIPGNGFSALRRLRELYIHDNEISMISDRPLSGLKNLQILDVSNNKIVALPSEFFSECASSIKQINLQNNSISVLSPGLFANLTQLISLDLSKNQLTSAWINNNTFSGLIRLVLLNLSHNRITKLDPNFFNDLYTLQILNLEYNSLKTIPPNTFAPMNNLHTLALSFNKITSLESYSLNGLYALSLLSLDNNELVNVDRDAFRNCTGLQDLNLNGNQLIAAPAALQDMRVLKTVDLGENSIKSLDEPGFKNMTNLYGLRLIGNQLTNISKNAFADLPSLQILNLARNRINYIEKGAFDGNNNLQAIRLDANLLTDITGLFNNISSLLWLNISDNRLNWFDYNLIPRGLQWIDLHKNAISEIGNRKRLEAELKIQTLDISFNKLTHVTPSSLPNSLELLFLNDNSITTVAPHTFLNKSNLTRVDLYANQIVEMDLNALLLTPVRGDRPLPEFYIGGNPFQCDCTMEWLQRINQLDHLRQHPRVMDLESIYCKLLYSRDRMYVPLVEAEPIHFLCEYKTHCFALCTCCEFDACDCEMTCPTNCTCYHDQSWSANIVDCVASDYTKMPRRIPMDATEVYIDGNNLGELNSHSFIGRKNLKVLYANNSNIAAIYNDTFSGLKRLTTLHLENNNIKELHGFELTPLEGLKELYLQNNKIYYINNRTFVGLKNLEVLRLDNNRLNSFMVWQLTLNPYLVEIGLLNNQWSCECAFVNEFGSWLLVNYGKVLDADKIVCVIDNVTNTLGPAFKDLNGTVCDNYAGGTRGMVGRHVIDDYLPLFLCSIFAFAFSIMLVCGIFVKRREIRVWIYTRCGVRMCYKSTAFEDELDRTRLYDAYVSYNIKDDDFVSHTLVPGLEQSNLGFRLCLHYRDFNISAYVADTILEGVECSRRTIVVLSKNFLQSEWCRFEFKSSLYEAMRDRRRRMIFIVLGDIPQRDLDPDLRLYLKTNTTIEWGDSQFWQKLRFAMPDPPKMIIGPPPLYDSGPNLPSPPHPPPGGKLLPPFLHHPNNLQIAAHRDSTRRIVQPLWA